MRYLSVLPLALILNALLFWFIHGLIDFGSRDSHDREQLSIVEVSAPPPDAQSEPEEDQAPEPEPSQSQNAADSEAAPALPEIPLPASPRIETPGLQNLSDNAAQDIAMNLQDGDLAGSLGRATAGLSPSGSGSTAGGKLKARLEAAKPRGGYKEIVPVGTRQPDVPKEAWDKKIDGWVTVAFVVAPNGRVRNVQVVDSSPKGVFEANVVEAVGDWVYEPGKKPHTLTQRIDLYWKDYPNNVKRPGQP